MSVIRYVSVFFGDELSQLKVKSSLRLKFTFCVPYFYSWPELLAGKRNEFPIIVTTIQRMVKNPLKWEVKNLLSKPPTQQSIHWDFHDGFWLVIIIHKLDTGTTRLQNWKGTTYIKDALDYITNIGRASSTSFAIGVNWKGTQKHKQWHIIWAGATGSLKYARSVKYAHII